MGIDPKVRHYKLVREGGLEPPRFYSLAPQTSVSTIPPSAHL